MDDLLRLNLSLIWLGYWLAGGLGLRTGNTGAYVDSPIYRELFHLSKQSFLLSIGCNLVSFEINY